MLFKYANLIQPILFRNFLVNLPLLLLSLLYAEDFFAFLPPSFLVLKFFPIESFVLIRLEVPNRFGEKTKR